MQKFNNDGIISSEKDSFHQCVTWNTIDLGVLIVDDCCDFTMDVLRPLT